MLCFRIYKNSVSVAFYMSANTYLILRTPYLYISVVTDLIENTSNNDTHYGRVKLYRRNVWGQVCSTFWSDLDAAVYCRQMNYTGGYALKYKSISGIPFVKTGINCNGNESDIDTCQSQTQICYDGDAAGVLCYINTGNNNRDILAQCHNSCLDELVTVKW